MKVRFVYAEISGGTSTKLSFEGKTCVSCEQLLPYTSFYRRGAGYHSYCKLCHRDRTLELRAARKAVAA